ncbi:sigma-70 family RNA polymerase sigma factor [PVC group bacterium]|nr:sigma-70 family RNA polymerase sigma factor [PVC group bacterium]
MNNMDDLITQDIIKKASTGDLDAFEKIYRYYAGFVFNVSLRVTNDRETAKDVSQEVFLTVYRKLKNFRFDSSFKTWLYRIAMNTAINTAKKESKIKEKALKSHIEEPGKPWQNDVNKHMDQVDNEQRLNTLLSKLQVQERACMVLKHIEGLSCQDIADALKMNVNTVKTKLRRAREKLMTLRKDVVKNEL